MHYSIDTGEPIYSETEKAEIDDAADDWMNLFKFEKSLLDDLDSRLSLCGWKLNSDEKQVALCVIKDALDDLFFDIRKDLREVLGDDYAEALPNQKLDRDSSTASAPTSYEYLLDFMNKIAVLQNGGML